MRRTYAYFISLLLFLISSPGSIHAQDTILIPLKIRIGLEVAGPAQYYSNKNVFNSEGYITVDLNEKKSVFLSAGYLNYKYSQYNYEYLNKGIFMRTGIDFNLLKPDKAQGKYWAGIGLHYGLSIFSSEIPSFYRENYWGVTTSSIPRKTYWGHFIEASPGVRAEIFNHFSIGWGVSLRMLLYTGTGKGLPPIYFPGFGNGANSFSAGLNYFIVWNIPYKKIKVILKKEVPEESDETENPDNKQQSTDTRQQSSGFRRQP
jgi:hypothetical protein